jgi:predicted DNA-binding transcriptional regulator AlpA
MAKISNEELVAALMQHGSVSEAAEAIGLSSRAFYDRMKQTEFRLLYAEARNDLLRSAAASMRQRIGEAVATIAEIMQDKEAPAAVRLQASQTILNNALKFCERITEAEATFEKDRKSAEIDAILGTINL